MNKFIIIGGLLCAGGLFCRPAQAQFHDQIGLTALRAVTTNLNGAGLRVAVPEANLYTNGPAGFEINPANVGQPASLFTYASAAGTTNVYPNAVGTNSWHAEDTGNYFFGMFYGVATNVAHVDNSDADYFITNIVQTLAAIPDTIVNQSFADYDLSSQSYYNTNYDNYADQYKTLFITAAGDGGPVLPPSTCYNGISVAAYFFGRHK